MKAAIILFNADFKNFNRNDYDIVVGCDRGAYLAILNNIKLDIAVGDFDSISQEELKVVYDNSKEVIKLNPIKDDSDTDHAINMLNDYDEIVIHGGILGKRIEHFYAILLYLKNNSKLKLKDENSFIETVNYNDNYIVKEDYKFISIFSLEDTIITLKGFKYNLDNYNLLPNNPLGLSNEIINNPIIDIKKGRILIIYSKKDEGIL